ncbi:MAG TPA: chorismate synthase [Candidatus Nanoarchaeia archaeon]|nr:chorismate synthase [Candidatus Nanoarchaeia archaeon]
MSYSTFGKYFRVTTWGESHGRAIGAVIDGVKPNLPLSEEDIQKDLDRRKPGLSAFVSPRKEEDKVEILSGVFEGKTTGTPISLIIYNKDVDSSKYEKIKQLIRPGHAMFTYMKKYGIYDYRGGGRASARETAMRVAAGAIAKKILAEKGIKIVAYVREVGGIVAKKIDYAEIQKNPVNCPDKDAAKKIEKAILKVRGEGDSLGGIVEVVAENVPGGIGDPVFDKLDATIAMALMSIPAVKGVEIGAGFQAGRMKGSESNDVFAKRGNKIITVTNNAGGILGGISNGMPILARVAVKPTSSIAREQETVDIEGRKQKIKVEGRHDPCIAIRAVPVVEAMMALTIIDALMKQEMVRGA